MHRFLPLLLPVLLLSACAASAVPKGSLSTGTFSMDASGKAWGTAYVRGYAMVTRIQEPFCSHDPDSSAKEANCQAFDYAYLRVQQSGTDALVRFIVQNRGNTFMERNAIGLGCVGSGTITYVNDSDRYGEKTVTLPAALSQKILRSTSRAPITLALTKEKLSGGSGAPPCYGHFTEVKEVQE